jgi:hypothetical protein
MKKTKLPFPGNQHVDLITAIAKGMNKAGFNNRYLELGIRKGPCFNSVAPYFKEAYAVDIRNCRKFIKHNKNLIWFCGTTDDFLRKHNKNKLFDMVFIDADHKHESSLKDFENVKPLTREGGLILFHDTYPPSEKFITKKYCNDTYKTAEYIRKYYPDFEFVTFPFYYGVSVFRNLKRQLIWM